MKKIGIVLTISIGIIVILYFGLHLFSRMIYNTQSCERFNIDNIELRTGVNIPEIKSYDCECTNNKKFSKFIIDTDKVDLDDYVTRNNFTLKNDLYIKEDDNKDGTYKVAFDKTTDELTVNLTYK